MFRYHGEPTANLLRESAAKRGEDWSRLTAATAKLGAAWAEFTLALDAYRGRKRMLHLYLRHEASGITCEVENPDGEHVLSWDLRDATMALIDKVAAAKGTSAIDVMATSPTTTIVAKWEVRENGDA